MLCYITTVFSVVPQRWPELLPENGSRILIGQSQDRNVVRFSASGRLWGGALRDYTKNGCLFSGLL